MTAVERKLATVLAVRLRGYQAMLVGARSAEATELHAWFRSVIGRFGGTERSGDDDVLLADFGSATQSLAAVTALGDSFAEQAGAGATELRMALHIGELIIDGQRVTGEAAVIATALTEQARPGGGVVSTAVYEQLRDQVDVGFLSLGEFTFEHVARPVGVYRLAAAGQTRSVSDILSELARRRVFRTAGAYVVVAWLIVQASDIVLEAFAAPPWVQRSLITLLAAGFPLIMLLTWTLNLSAEGLVKTPDTGYSQRVGRWLKFAVVGSSLALSGTILWFVWAGVSALDPVADDDGPTSIAPPENPVVLVAPLVNASGDNELDGFGPTAADLIRNRLVGVDTLVVYSMAALKNIEAGVSAPAELARAAAAADVDYLVTGIYLKTTDGMTLTAQVTRLVDSTVVQSPRIEADDLPGLIAQLDNVTTGIKLGLGLPYEQNVGHLAADFAASNLPAYELYVSGLEFLTLYDYDNAEQLLTLAIERAPDFGMARYRLAQIYEATGEHDVAIEMLDEIDVDALSKRERYFVEGARHKFVARRDLAQAASIYQNLVADYPFDSESLQNLAEALYLDYREAESIQWLKKLTELHPREYVSWMALGERQLDLGLYEDARASLREYVAMRPEDPYAHALLAQLNAEQGDWPVAIEHYDTALTLQPHMGLARNGKARVLYASGSADAATALWEKTLQDSRISPAERVTALFDFAHVSRALGANAAALAALDGAAADLEATQNAWVAHSLAIRLHADNGDLQAAGRSLEAAVESTPAQRYPIRPLLFFGLAAAAADNVPLVEQQIERLQGFDLGDPLDIADRDAAVFALQAYTLQGSAAVASASAALTREDAYRYVAFEKILAELQLANSDTDAARKTLGTWLQTGVDIRRLDLEHDRLAGSKMLAALRANGTG